MRHITITITVTEQQLFLMLKGAQAAGLTLQEALFQAATPQDAKPAWTPRPATSTPKDTDTDNFNHI